MEKIVKVTYKVPVLEYRNNGWEGTAEMDNSEFETFDKAALLELLCKEILRTVIDDYIVDDCAISNWESFQYDVERFLKGDTIVSELFPNVTFAGFEYDDEDEIRSFTINLTKNISPITSEGIYLTFEY